MPLKIRSSWKKLVSRKKLSPEKKKTQKQASITKPQEILAKVNETAVDDAPTEKSEVESKEKSTLETSDTEENKSVTVECLAYVNETVVDDIPTEKREEELNEESTVETDDTEENNSVIVTNTIDSDKLDSNEPKDGEKPHDAELKEEPQQDDDGPNDAELKEEPQQASSLGGISFRSEEEEEHNVIDKEDPSQQQLYIDESQEEQESKRASTPRVPPPPLTEIPEEETALVASSASPVQEVQKEKVTTENENQRETEDLIDEHKETDIKNSGLFCGCF